MSIAIEYGKGRFHDALATQNVPKGRPVYWNLRELWDA